MEKTIKIAKENCIGCGTCASLYPKAFKIGDDGKAEVIDQKILTEEEIKNAMDSCPRFCHFSRIKIMNQKILPVLIILLVIASFLAGSFWQKLQKYESGTNNPQNQGATPSAAKPTNSPIDSSTFAKLASGRNSKGNKDAKVTIVEFSDFECPYCGRFFKETYPQIDKEYIKTNKVRYVFYSYPLPFHTNAQKASEAAECAGDQGKFWEMHDTLYSDQTKLAVSDLKKSATTLGLDISKFNACLDGGNKKDLVTGDLTLGQNVGVNGTPAFFINGKLISGAQPFANFKQVIDAELAK